MEGSLKTGKLEDMSQYNNMIEVILADDEEKYVIYPEGTVEDIRLTIAGDNMTIPDHTVFMAFELSGRDAVILYAAKNHASNMDISYYSNNETHTINVID